MLYLRDVWVNWFEGEENGYNVCEFHEWRKDDFIELLDQVPIVKLESSLFHYIENELSDLPDSLLDEVHQKAYVRKNNQRVQLDHCFIITDEKKTMVIDTMGYRIPIRKSRLIPRQEQLVYEMAEQMETVSYTFTPDIKEKEHHILSPEPVVMRGLTRKERQLKQLLFMLLDQLHTTQNVAEVRYWYTEWMPEEYMKIQSMEFEEAWAALYSEIKDGWSNHHYAICERLVKGQPYFEKIWELENGTHVN
ncbi:YjbA family protein [Fictibacillus enclensis]|uniref:YjbA family protein n=1 Tax=Fictibacillus enclensis TaxID=1017270 RepID=UPI0024C021B0|nr:YjbA family protein [Fictibacillus enclensis]MDM5198614.1 YjbA family protein [Fictibacillus enclensis]MDM5337817.1 YjbA family protein [Fictibacillus enclensis]WHY74179.1 YjbA family protein [Fictibacillus enclensis]